MAVNRQIRQRAPRSTMLGKAIRWWLDGWVMFVRFGGGNGDVLDQRRWSPMGRSEGASHD